MSAAVTAAGEVWTFGGGFNGELGTGASWSPGARRVEGILAQVGIYHVPAGGFAGQALQMDAFVGSAVRCSASCREACTSSTALPHLPSQAALLCMCNALWAITSRSHCCSAPAPSPHFPRS